MTEANTCHLVLLETSGNQAYIYGTNRLRDIIGASELVHRAGTIFVAEALEDIKLGELAAALEYEVKKKDQPRFDLSKLPEWMLHRQRKIEGDADAEVLVATSGKALLLFKDRDTAKAFITAWSKRIVREAPGLDAFGVIAPNPVDLTLGFDDAKPDADPGDERPVSIARAIREAHRAYEEYRNRRPSPEARFQRLPFAEACGESRLPANTLKHKTRNPESEVQPAALARAAKIDARDSGEIEARWNALYNKLKAWFRDPDKMEKAFGELPWFGVVHADGNGLGQIFLNFGDYVDVGGLVPGRAYINCYREFSLQIDEEGQKAFRAAAGVVHESKGVEIPVVPIVVGGDDLTVLLDGQQAIDFAKRYVDEFCKATGTAGGAMGAVLAKAQDTLKAARLGACAGVSITKSHFPFSVSYHLAGGLTKSAKQVKTALCHAAAALDFHILYDSSASDIEPARKRYILDNELRLTSKPYVISARGYEDDDWYKKHRYERFGNALEALRAKKDERLKLSSTQAHAVRERMFLEDKETQETFWDHALRKADLTKKWKETSPDGKTPTLFVEDAGEGYTHSTVFLDALEAREFVAKAPGEEEVNHD